MTERWIKSFAERFDLATLKRITTGSADRHFATFELTGKGSDVFAAWEELRGRPERRGPAFERLATCDVKGHPDYGLAFVEISSVWCDETEGGAR